MNYWLLKSEPDVFGIEHLQAQPGSTGHWDGVRSYQARNFLRAMRVGDQAFFYHSSCAEPGVVGIVEVVREGYPDFTAWDPRSGHYDPKSSEDKPIWYMVDVRLVRRFGGVVSLHTLKQRRDLKDMQLLKRGNRLSVMPITAPQWRIILTMAKGAGAGANKPRR